MGTAAARRKGANRRPRSRSRCCGTGRAAVAASCPRGAARGGNGPMDLAGSFSARVVASSIDAWPQSTARVLVVEGLCMLDEVPTPSVADSASSSVGVSASSLTPSVRAWSVTCERRFVGLTGTRCCNRPGGPRGGASCRTPRSGTAASRSLAGRFNCFESVWSDPAGGRGHHLSEQVAIRPAGLGGGWRPSGSLAAKNGMPGMWSRRRRFSGIGPSNAAPGGGPSGIGCTSRHPARGQARTPRPKQRRRRMTGRRCGRSQGLGREWNHARRGRSPARSLHGPDGSSPSDETAPVAFWGGIPLSSEAD